MGTDPLLVKDGTGGRKPINAKAETVASLPTFRDALQASPLPRAGRQLLRVEGDQGTEDQAALRHPMKSGEPFALNASAPFIQKIEMSAERKALAQSLLKLNSTKKDRS